MAKSKSYGDEHRQGTLQRCPQNKKEVFSYEQR
jgi:hypothetical protein